ncbi:MAG: glycosyltransferase family 39 protein [Saprospiraceae bacterium]|nr:glycosyltransferase family 39 protein [Saprospiraceae bacterium]
MFNNVNVDIKDSNKWYFIAVLTYIMFWTLLRAQYIDMPFYWDEAWVYAPGLRHMMESGPSLLPDAIPEFYSRGHPLLFYFLGGIWLKIFGTSFVAYHTFPLTISVLFLFFIFITVREWTNSLIAISVMILISVAKIFYTEAANVLPEILVALFFLLSVRYFLKEKLWLYILFASLGIMTKESGIVIPGAILCGNILWNFKNSTSPFSSDAIKKSLLILAPILTFLIFLIVQYIYKGWFLFPEHTGMMIKKSTEFVEKLNFAFEWLLEDGQIYWMSGCLSVLLVFGGKEHQRTTLFMSLIGILIAMYVIKNFNNNIEFMALMAFAILLGSIHLIGRTLFGDTDIRLKKILLINFAVYLTYLIFCSVNFVTVRYLITLLPFGFFLYLVTIKTLSPNTRIFCGAVVFLIAVLAPENFAKNRQSNLIAQIAYVEMRYDLVKKLEALQTYDSSFGINDFVIRRTLQDPYSGFLSSAKVFTKVDWSVDEGKEYIVISNFDPYPEFVKQGNFGLVHKWEEGVHWMELWKRNK